MKSCHFDNMNESRGYFAEQNKPRRWKTNTACSLLCVESKKKKKKKGKQNHRDRTNECLAEGWGVGKIGVGDEEL